MKPTPLAIAAWRTAVAVIVSTMTAAIVAFAVTTRPSSDAAPASGSDHPVQTERIADTLR